MEGSLSARWMMSLVPSLGQRVASFGNVICKPKNKKNKTKQNKNGEREKA